MIKMTILVKRPSETSGDLRRVHGWAIHYSTWRDLRQSNVTQDYAIANSHDPIQRSNYTDNLKHSIPPIIDQLSIKLANFYVPLKELVSEKSLRNLGTTNVKIVTRHDPWTLFIDDRRSIGQIAPRYFNESMFGEDWRSTRFENFHVSIFRSVD